MTSTPAAPRFPRAEVEAAFRRTRAAQERVVFLWKNRMPGLRADGSHYEFSGITTMLYAGDGRFSYQEDVYNFVETRRVMKEWAADQAAH